MDGLFDIIPQDTERKEPAPVDKLKELDGKIASAIAKVKALKDEKTVFEHRIKAMQETIADLESRLRKKDEEIERITSDKYAIRGQIEDLLNELETLGTN